MRDFPQALSNLLDKENVFYYDAVYESRDGLYYLAPVAEDLLLQVHSANMIEAVRQTGDFEAALYSAGGTVQAASEIWKGNIDNAFVFTSFGDHHAGRDFYGGMCYFNGAALAIASLRQKGMRRFAIVDTDAHHADGTRDIFARDNDVLHCCFCFQDYHDQYNKMDVRIPYRTTDEYYLDRMKQAFVQKTLDFAPEIIFWEYGFDATRGEYGDKGLSRDCHLKIAEIIKGVADRACRGRMVAILCGGSGRRLAAYTIPHIIAILAELETGQ
ncbi:MAG: Hist deacetyl protein [Dehalococcoidia bacterium]|nr:Hist deacetyl protein [Dehalococcoidia bacterium]